MNRAKYLDSLFELPSYELVEDAYKRIIGILDENVEIREETKMHFKDENMLELQTIVKNYMHWLIQNNLQLRISIM